MKMNDVGRLNAELSDEAHSAWRKFATAHGVSVTALLEAMGQAGLTETIDAATVDDARRIDSERRQRGLP